MKLTFEKMAEKMYGTMGYDKLTPEQKLKVESKLKEQATKLGGIKSDKDIPMRCDLCGQTFPMGSLTHDTNFGWVCKKCEESEVC